MNFATKLIDRYKKRQLDKAIQTAINASGTPVKIEGTGSVDSTTLPPAVLKKLGLSGKRPKGDRVRSEKFRARHYRLPDGAKWNPLRKFPVNKECFCGSKIKFKNCCDRKLVAAVHRDFAKYINANWDKLIAGDLTLGGKNLPVPEVKK